MDFRLLVVDDHRDSADSLATLLKLEGYQVRVAYGGEEAIAAAREFHPGALIVDLVMPQRNGYQVAQELRSLPEFERVHFVALSGLEEQTHLDEASKAQFDDYLVKPPQLSVLLAILAEVSGQAGKSGTN